MYPRVSGFPLVFPATALFLISLMLGAQLAPSVRGQSTPVDDGDHVFLPIVFNGADIPDPDREWDPRLDQRGAVLIEATVTPGEGYWRLIKARWYNAEESEGRHHIFVDLLNENEGRQVGAPVLVTWAEGSTTIVTEAKPREEYAADFAMFSLAPAYAARPYDGAPADMVDGMGMGDIDAPDRGIHTSYGLIWQWTVADIDPTITPTTTPVVTIIPTVSLTGSPTITPTVTVTSTLTITPTITVTPTPTATPTPIPTPTFTPTPDPGYVFSRAEVESCVPGNSGTRVEGVVYYNDQPADGYDVVFSWQPDGEWSTPPTTSGPNPPGAYTHIINDDSGDWWVWIVDEAGARISPMATFTVNEACRVATVNFYGP